MKLLLDHCVPRRLGRLLVGHQVVTTAEIGWDRLRNGALLTAAGDAGLDAMITVDQNLRHQQNLATFPIAVVVMCSVSNDIDELAKLVPDTLVALETLQPKVLVEVRLSKPDQAAS